MATIEIHGDEAISIDLREFPAKVTRATVRALNRSIGSARTLMVREIAKDTGLKSKDVRDKLVMPLASEHRLEASLRASTKRVPLFDFGARQTRAGVTAKLTSGAGRYPGLFIATMRAGATGLHTGVFGRTGKFGRNENPRLERIKERFGPSLGRVFAKFRPLGLAKALEVFQKNFDHELDFAKTEGPAPDA